MAALAVIGGMALMPAAAAAQTDTPPWWHSTPDPDYAFTTATGTVFVVALGQLNDETNQQTFSGYYNGNPAAGLVVHHFYDRTTDSGSYLLSGNVVNPLGIAVPMLATITVKADRSKDVYITSVSGDVGGVPFADSDRTFVNPFYSPRS